MATQSTTDDKMATEDVARPEGDAVVGDSLADHDMPDAISPRQNAPPIEQTTMQAIESMRDPLNSLEMRADPDAQATVTDFLDFTEYLPSDMMRSLTLIGKLDQTHADASSELDKLTTQWGELPTIPQGDKPNPVDLRARISETLLHAVGSRIYSHAEAVRMAENVNRHYKRAKTILAKLQAMMENYPPPEEQKSPVATSKSPQVSGAAKITLRVDGNKVRRQRVPRITVPGEVLAPYELNYDAYTSEDESSSDDEDEDNLSQRTSRVTPASTARIKVVKGQGKPKPEKVRKSAVSHPHAPSVGISTSAALAKLGPPPEDAVIGSDDAPWGQLTAYELAKLRKRMKKNAAWTPSDTMVARELSALGRGVEAYKAAKQKAEAEGIPFEGKMPAPIIDPVTGKREMPLGALALDALAADEKNLSNRGMKLNEAKKLKRENLAKMAAEEAEESARRFDAIARTLMSDSSSSKVQDQSAKPASKPRSAAPPKKRKRDSAAEAEAEKPELAEGNAQRPQFKRTKTETPVPPPNLTPGGSQTAQETPVPAPQRTPVPAPVLHSTTPIPLPIHGQDQSITAKSTASVTSATSPAPSSSAGPSSTAALSLGNVKLPPTETPIPPPIPSPKKSTTPIHPPIVRETRKTQAARVQEQQQPPTAPKEALPLLNTKPASRVASPAPITPSTAADPDAQSATAVTAPTSASSATTRGAAAAAAAAAAGATAGAGRPASRGKATSQEPQHPSLAADRPRRASTARNTPAPEPQTASGASSSSRTAAAHHHNKRTKRPAPGIISKTEGGGNSAVGKRKTATKKKKAARNASAAASTAAGAAGATTEMVEVDDEGHEIDPHEPRYCLCNRVSFGTMIQCDNNVDNRDDSKDPSVEVSNDLLSLLLFHLLGIKDQ